MAIRALCLALLVPALAVAQERPSERRTIVVDGQGEVRATPDRAQLSFAVETTAARAGDAAAENAKRSAAVVAAVKPLAGAGGAVATTRYSIEPRYETARPGEPREPRITGYVAHSEVRVTDAPIDGVGAMIDAAVGAGANRVGGLQFTFAKQDELLRAALEKAGADARAQADSVARGLGVRLKGVVSATTHGRPMPIQPRFEAMVSEARAAPTPIEPGEASVSATVQVTFEIE
ncbi:MAG TPA: SIMPL domain-containing protein [Candidatus Binatia bacterium]|nr:SIMPL domain-containing protein [Candidatus Binatia bacterium]